MQPEWLGVISPTSVLEYKAVQNHKSAERLILICITEVKPFPKFKQIKFCRYLLTFTICIDLLVIMLMDCGYLCQRHEQGP